MNIHSFSFKLILNVIHYLTVIVNPVPYFDRNKLNMIIDRIYCIYKGHHDSRHGTQLNYYNFILYNINYLDFQFTTYQNNVNIFLDLRF